MVDWDFSGGDPARVAERAWADVEAEARKLGELGKFWEEARTTVRAKDHSVEMTFDGRGELVDVVFHGSKYRAMAPAQLAAVLVETAQRGRERVQERMAELMGTPALPTIDLSGLATGKVTPDQLVESILGPVLAAFDEPEAEDPPRPDDRTKGDRGDG
ncbi:YbaB/EbfC family nucleoid-associated protein [Actinosynnema sp. NPDC050436]|uniref:YbaB/EbfC family nucleoid-associated protein n=1 Tax=Actinosynnema sp. NPDC050436 TaxID=3155659 RepID=UPI0033F6FFA6